MAPLKRSRRERRVGGPEVAEAERGKPGLLVLHGESDGAGGAPERGQRGVSVVGLDVGRAA